MGVGFARVSIFCRHLERSLAFYRDLLGMVAVEDKVIEGPAAGALLQLPACRMRIVLLAVVFMQPGCMMSLVRRPWASTVRTAFSSRSASEPRTKE